MTTFLLSILLLFTIVAAFAFGVAVGYWVICGFLNLFHPNRTREQTIQRASPGAHGKRGLEARIWVSLTERASAASQAYATLMQWMLDSPHS